MRRREFIKASALTASSLLVPMIDRVVADETPADELQIALIGVGYQGRNLLNATIPIDGVRFRAVCDIWEYARGYGQKYLARNGQDVNVYADYRELLDREKDLDAVLIATPDFVHAPQTNACLEAGLHVYCEAMMADSVAAARSMVQAMQSTGKLLQIGYQRRSNPRYRHVFERLIDEADLLGRLSAVQTQWAEEAGILRGWPRRHTIADAELKKHGYASMEEFRNWRWHSKYCGGPFCAYVSHQIDICQWFLRALPQAVMASGGGDFYDDRPSADTIMSVFEFPNEEGTIRAACNMFTTTSAGGTRQFERFLGADGSIQISENPRWTRIGKEPSGGDWDKWIRRRYLVRPDIPAVHEADDNAINVHVSGEIELFQLPPLTPVPNFQPHLENFFAAIRGTETLRCPADVAFPSQVAAFRGPLEAVDARKALSLDWTDDET